MEYFQRPLCLFFVLFITFLSTSQANKFYVGGKDGWTPNPSENYTQWSGRNRFQVNDTIVFKYKKGSDSVLEVKKEDYDKCSKANPLKKFDEGDTEVLLDRPGPFYFISGQDGNCEKGQKLIVVVITPRKPASPPSPPGNPPSVSPSPSISPLPAGKSPASSPTPAATSPSPSPFSTPPAPSATSPSPSPTSNSPAAGGPPAPSPIGTPTAGEPSSPGTPFPSGQTPGSANPPSSSNASAPPPANSVSSVTPSRFLVLSVTFVVGAAVLRY